MKKQSSAENAIDKVRAMIDGGSSVVPLRPNQNGPPELVGMDALSTSFFRFGASAFYRFKYVADRVQKQRVEAERGKAGQRQAVKETLG